MTVVTVLGIDLGKNSCSVAGLDEAGRVVLRRRVPKEGLAALLDKLPGCVAHPMPLASPSLHRSTGSNR